MLRNIYTIALCLALLSGCGYNTLQATDEAVKSGWGNVLEQYQRRTDLIPNLVNTIKGYASHEKEALTEVTNARARVTAMQATPELINDERAFEQYVAAQGNMSSTLSQLLLVAENYPGLKADGVFRDLQAQLESAESRITVARNYYIQSVQNYNTTVRVFPSNLTAKVFGFTSKPMFGVENEGAISRPPTVNVDSSEQGQDSPATSAPVEGPD